MTEPLNDPCTDTKHPETKPRRSRSALTPEALTSAMALTISVFALGVSLFEANTQRVQQRASVWPHIEISPRYTPNGYSIEIMNKGVGPARLGDVQLSFNGQRYADLDALIVAIVGPENAFSYELYRSSDVSQLVMSAGEQQVLFSVPWEERTRRLANAFAESGDVATCYCSIFDECWTVAMTEPGGQQPVARCDS